MFKMLEKNNLNLVKYIVFDVDGTLYDKNKIYDYSYGSIQESQDFFRFLAYDKLKKTNKSLEEVAKELVLEYNLNMDSGELLNSINTVHGDIREEYLEKIKKYGSNGKVFVNEFNSDSKYLHKNMLSHIRYDLILKPDINLKKIFKYLINKKYKLAMLTTETFNTVEKVSNAMNFDLNMFYMNTNSKYPILCSENVKEKKPSSEGFEKILESFNVKNPKEVIYIGDSFEKDIEAPLKLGIQAIHVKKINSPNKEILEKTSINNIDKEYIRINDIYQLNEIF